MEITDNTSAPNDTVLVSSVEGYGTSTDAPSYDIAPEDQHHVDAVMRLDPFHDVLAPYDLPEGRSFGKLKLTALTPDLQGEVRQRLLSVPADQREAMEEQFTADVIKRLRPSIRAMTGLSSEATPYHREMMALTREYSDAAKEFDRLSDELVAVARHVTKVDPETGKAIAVPVYKVSAERRRAIEAEQHSLAIRMRLLHTDEGPGLEAAKRLKQAMFETVEARKEIARQIDENAEAKRRAAQINREDRINSQATRLAALNRNAT